MTRAFTESLESTMHDIELFGDSYLNAGRVVELKFPKTQDPLTRETPKNERYDEILSGKYLIVSAVHILKDGEYFTNIRVKRDSLTIAI